MLKKKAFLVTWSTWTTDWLKIFFLGKTQDVRLHGVFLLR
jgi:hypothetical protein